MQECLTIGKDLTVHVVEHMYNSTIQHVAIDHFSQGHCVLLILVMDPPPFWLAGHLKLLAMCGHYGWIL